MAKISLIRMMLILPHIIYGLFQYFDWTGSSAIKNIICIFLIKNIVCYNKNLKSRNEINRIISNSKEDGHCLYPDTIKNRSTMLHGLNMVAVELF